MFEEAPPTAGPRTTGWAPVCLAALALASGCYAAHERGEPTGECEGVEVWRFEDPGSLFQAVAVAPAERQVFGVVERDGHGLWRFGPDGAIRRGGPIAESRGGAMATIRGGTVVAGRWRRAWHVDRFDAAGEPVSHVELEVETEESFVVSVVPAEDGVFVVGSARDVSSAGDLLVVRVVGDAVAWSRRYGDGERRNAERPFGAFVDAEGRLVVLTQRWYGGSGGPFWLVALEDDGSVAWEQVGEIELARDSDRTFVVLDDGVLLVGTPHHPTGQRLPARVFRLDARGRTLWRTDLDVDGSGRQTVVGDAVEGDGVFVLAGYSAERTAGMIWGLREDGSLAFEESPVLPRADGTTLFNQIERFGDGYLLGGDRQWEGPTSWIFARVDARGRPRWVFEPRLDGRVFAPRAMERTEDGAIAVGMVSSGEGRERAGLALELRERCE